MTDNYLSRFRHQQATKDADQAEAAAYLHQVAALTEGIYDDRVASSLHESDPAGLDDDDQRWQREDLDTDSAAGSSQDEIVRRQSILGEAYPFEISAGKLRYRGHEIGLYEFLLAISVAPNVTRQNFRYLGRVFERVVPLIIAHSFGPKCNSMHVGSPRDKSAGKSFKAAMTKLAIETGEWIWGPEEYLNPARAKDEGLDFVVWQKPWDGRNIAHHYLLGQCACGNDWDTKFHDLDCKKLGKWFKPPWIVDPTKALAVPFHVVDIVLKESSREAGYIYDRARLVAIDHFTNARGSYSHYHSCMEKLTKLVLKP